VDVHILHLLLYVIEVVTGVADERGSHYGVEVVGILIIYGYTAPHSESLSDTTLDQVLVEGAEKQFVERGFRLLHGIEVQHIINIAEQKKC
jgi:hypothetical protein